MYSVFDLVGVCLFFLLICFLYLVVFCSHFLWQNVLTTSGVRGMALCSYGQQSWAAVEYGSFTSAEASRSHHSLCWLSDRHILQVILNYFMISCT